MRQSSVIRKSAAAADTGRAESRRDFFRRAVAPDQDARLAQMQAAYALSAAPAYWEDSRLRLLRRATNGISPADTADVLQLGYDAWLEQQLDYETIDDSACDAVIASRYPLLTLTAQQLATSDQGQVQNQLHHATIHRAAFSRRQLYERMVEFWSDHFNISFAKVAYLKVVDDRDVIRQHALGNFGDLVRASAHSPAMLAYLDQNTSRVGSPNQNYVRELMELHTLGVDGGYTQQDVDELARVFTGWTYNGAGNFVFQSNRHDFAAKTVLGVAIPATSPSIGGAAINEGEMMLNVLIDHPSTSKFISKKILMWLLTPQPTPAQIRTVATVFRRTGGDIRAVVRAVLNEAWVSEAPVKFKRPFHYLVSSLRATQPAVTALTTMNNQLNALGQRLFFFETPDGYPDTAEYWSGNMPPRWNFANTFVGLTQQTVVATAPYLSGTPAAAIDRIQADFFANELPPETRDALYAYITGGTFNATRVRETIALALSTSEFQWY